MLQSELTANIPHNKGVLNNMAKTDKQSYIVKRLEELNRWQEEEKKLLAAKQTMQRQMLDMEQAATYQMLGLTNDGCELSEIEDNVTPKAVSQEDMINNNMVEMQYSEEDSTEDSLTTSQLDNEEEVKEAQTKDIKLFSCKPQRSVNNIDECLDSARETKPKKPFLKKGEGLKQRFKIDPDQLRLNNLPRYKYANVHPRFRLKPSNKCRKNRDSQNNASTKAEIPLSATVLDAQEQRFQNLLISSKNTCSSTPENKSTDFSLKGHVMGTKSSITKKVNEFPPNEGPPLAAATKTPSVAWSKILDPQQIEPLQVPRQHSNSLPQSEESIFELLEQKASKGSFDMNSTCLKQFMQRRLSEKLNESDDIIPIEEHIRTKRLEPVIVNKPSASSLEGQEDEQSQLTEDSLSTDSDDTTHRTVETTEVSYASQNTAKVRVRFSDSNETHEYEEEPYIGLEEDSTRLTTDSLVYQEGQGDNSNDVFFEQFKQALFAALQLKADEYQNNNDTSQNSTSDTTLTPKDSIADNNTSMYPPDLQEKTGMIKLRLAELEKEINNFKENNVQLMKAKQDHELEKSLHAQEHLEAMDRLKDEKIQMEIYLHDERVKLEDEKREFEQQTKMKTQGLIAKERKECERLREQVSQLELLLKTKESNHTSAQARLRTQMRNMEREQKKLHEQIEQLMRENKRLENENLKISREQNNKILLEINRNIAKLAPKQIQNPSPPIPEEGPPTLGTSRTVSKCIVAAATANKISNKTHKATNTHFIIEKPSNNAKISSTSATMKTDQALENSFNLERVQKQQCHQQKQKICEKDDDEDDDILKEFQITPPKSFYMPSTADIKPSRPPTNSSKSPSKGQTQFPAPPPTSPRLNNGMKREIINVDGSKDIWYSNGNLKKISADGMIIRMLYFNKDIKETNINEGTVKYYYAETNTWHTTYLDGLEILEFPNGQVEHRHKNGVIEIHYPNNSIKTMDPKDEYKQEEWRFADGTHLVQMRNGDKILSLPNGQKEIHNKLHKRREYPDGTVKIVYPDDSTETRYSNGRVRLKDKDGKLVMDTDLAN